MTELSDVELVALAGAVKDKVLSAAKSRLPDGSAHLVDFTVRIAGSVQKGTGTADAQVEVDPVVSLRSFGVFCAVLRMLGIGQVRLAKALLDVDPQPGVDEDLEATFRREESRRAQKLPKTIKTTPGRAGAVQSQVTASKLAG